jgi:predicted O-linked N-acetylglucosamine transferase (SPINDLY family)
VYKKGISYHPKNIDLHLRLIWLLQNNYPIEVAIQAIKSALEYLPDHLSLKLELMRLMPIVYPNQMERIAQHILDNQLHILVYLDIGMDPRTTQLAGLRLAPVQCVTWGHPITSGLPTIDYFISSELMEPAEGDNHYSEKLIRLSNLGIAYPKPSLPPQRKTR